MKRLVLATLILCALTLPAFAAKKGSAKVINQSRWDIHHLFLSPVSEDHWGADQLGKHVLQAGGSFTLTGIPCDEYDVKLVDEDGDECVVPGVELCVTHSVWMFDDEDLLECEGYE
jgi:hypothetical protein